MRSAQRKDMFDKIVQCAGRLHKATAIVTGSDQSIEAADAIYTEMFRRSNLAGEPNPPTDEGMKRLLRTTAKMILERVGEFD